MKRNYFFIFKKNINKPVKTIYRERFVPYLITLANCEENSFSNAFYTS